MEGGSSGQVSVYTKLARKLAHVDKAVRDAGLENVRSFLQKRVLPCEEMMLVWKALFYCHWHSDKPLVQQELARSLSGLLSEVGWSQALVFWTCFYDTMGREWQGIDRLRLDKFYDLCRCMSQAMLTRLKQQAWAPAVLQPFVLALEEHVLRNAALAVTLHFIDYFVADLTEAQCPTPATFLQPVLGLFATCENKLVLQRILENVIGKANGLPGLDLAALGKRCFALGAFPETAQKNRKFLYRAARELGATKDDDGEQLGESAVVDPVQLERDAKFEKANAKRKRIKIAKATSIDTVMPHVPSRATMSEEQQVEEPEKRQEAPTIDKAKLKLKKKKLEMQKQQRHQQQQQQQQEQQQHQQQQNQHTTEQTEAKPVLRKREPEVAVNERELLAVPMKKAKPSADAVATAPSPPKMVKTAKKTPNSTGKSVVFALEKNTTHTFKKDQSSKRRMSWF